MPVLDPFDGQDHSRDVVVYHAIVRFTVEQGTLWYNPAYSDEKKTAMLTAPLTFPYKGKWPPARTPDGGSYDDVLAYTKLAAGLALRTKTGKDATPSALRESVYARSPDMHPRIHACDRDQYSALGVTVHLDENGAHGLGIFVKNDGLPLPVAEAENSWDPIEILMLLQADLAEKALAATR